MTDNKQAPIITGPQDGAAVSIAGGTYRVLASGAQTGGLFATIDMQVPPGGGPGPHSHADFAETFYVVEGEVEVRSEYGQYLAGKGSYITIPKGGVVHYFKNKSDKLAHLLCTVIPAGLDQFFLEVGQPVKWGEFLPPAPMDAEAINKLQALAAKYGQQVFPPDYLDKDKS